MNKRAAESETMDANPFFRSTALARGREKKAKLLTMCS
jgi:hypothetical protein